MIRITGAAAHFETAIINHLLTKISANQIVALVRTEDKGKSLKAKGIEVRIGEYSDKTSIEKSVQGITKLLLVSSNSENDFTEHKNVIDAAKDAGISQICCTSGARNEKVAESKLKEYGVSEMDIWYSTLLTSIIRNDEYNVVSSDLETLLGNRPTDLEIDLEDTFIN